MTFSKGNMKPVVLDKYELDFWRKIVVIINIGFCNFTKLKILANDMVLQELFKITVAF